MGIMLNACSNVDVENQGWQGEMATISLKLMNDSPQEINTKAVDESSIFDMHVLVYNNKGELVSKKFTQGGSTTLTTRSGNNCTIFAVANTGNPFLFDKAIASTISQLRTMLANPLSGMNDIISNGRLLMSGSVSNVNIQGGSSVQPISGLIVKRLASKITLNVNAINGITINKYRICNLKNNSYLIHRPNANEGSVSDLSIGDDAPSAYFNGEDIVRNASSFTYSFYMYENRQGGRAAVSGGVGNVANQQEKARYAPNNATYLEVYASGIGFDAIYRIYLGGDNCKNYNVKRGSTYNYSITIKAANVVDTRVSRTNTTANCYMLAPGRSITIDVNTKGNGSTTPVFYRNGSSGAMVTPTHSTGSVAILWQSTPNLINNISGVVNGTVTLSAGNSLGNAVIAAYDGANGTGTILWSWHIWVTDYAPSFSGTMASNGAVHYYDASVAKGYMMDRNLGALNANQYDQGTDSWGMHYQWGRKDPIPGSAATSNLESIIYRATGGGFSYNTYNDLCASTGPVSIATAITTPGVFYRNMAGGDWNATPNNDLWGNEVRKTIFDPCPYGWKVPPIGIWSNYSEASIVGGFNRGYVYRYSGNNTAWYPGSGYREERSGAPNDVVIRGLLWPSSAVGAGFIYQYDYVHSTHGADYAQGFSVRCIRE